MVNTRRSLLWVLLVAGCTSPGTQALIVLDTDAPERRSVRVQVTARYGADVARAERTLDFAAMRDPMAFPASFAVLPRAGERSERVTLRFNVTVSSDATAPEVRYSVERSFQFLPSTRQRLGVYLPLRCGDPAVGCPPEVTECTVAALCSSRGQTCGDDATCVDPRVVPEVVTGPYVPRAELDVVRRDTGIDAADDARDFDVLQDRSAPEVATDGPDVPEAAIDARDVVDVQSDLGADVVTCPMMMTQCGGACVDTQTDNQHCGACNTPCGGTCASGRCAPTALLSVGRNVVCAGFGTPPNLVRCWGDNNFGERGTGTTAPSALPAEPVMLSSRLTALATGASSSCVVIAGSGEIQCWGLNSSGQLGDGTIMNRLAPVRAGTLSAQRGVSMGSVFACAWSDTAADCWGRGNSGQIGDGMSMDRLTPTRVVGLSSIRQVSAANVHACAVRQDGSVLCWGDNSAGAAGQPTAMARVASPTVVAGINATAIATGGLGTASSYSAALTGAGEVWTWGSNNAGQLGQPAIMMVTSTPGRVMGLPVIQQLAAGISHLCARAVSGSVYCWGSNLNGALGAGSTATTSNVPLMVPGITDAVDIAAGQTTTCVRRATGEISCWGNNAQGQLGQGTSSRLAELPPVPTITDAVSVHAGQNFTCAVTATGAVRCWGNNAFGQLGDGTRTSSRAPVATSLTGVRTMDAMGESACAVQMAGGGVFCWGNNQTGQLANGREGDSQPMPTQVAGVAGIIGIAMERHVLAWSATNAFAWGYCIEGQCSGFPPTGRRFMAEPFAAAHTVVAAGAGTTHSCSLSASGQAYCVGSNGSGQLGEPAFMGGHGSQRTVTAVADAVEIESGFGFNCARRRDNTVQCWGNNGAGQLGDGTTTNRHTVATVSGVTDTAQLSVGVNHVCARRTDGTIRCWGGNNVTSVLGAAPPMPHVPTPALPLPPSRWVSAGTTHTCVVSMDRNVRCWGETADGQLGVSLFSSVPVTVRL
jgi:alpha-tubulin suppressor-like RCC1 family protein